MFEANAMDHRHEPADAVQKNIFFRNINNLKRRVGCEDRAAVALRRGDGEYARTCSDVDHAAEVPPLEQSVQRQQGTQRAAMMTGAKGLGGFNLDGFDAMAEPRSIVAAMDQKLAGLHGWSLGLGFADPIGGGDRLDPRRCHRFRGPRFGHAGL